MTTIDFHFNEIGNKLKQNSTILGKPYYHEGLEVNQYIFVAHSEYKGINILLPANKIKVDGTICLYLNDKILGRFNISELSTTTTALSNQPIPTRDQIRMELECNTFEGNDIFRIQLQFISDPSSINILP